MQISRLPTDHWNASTTVCCRQKPDKETMGLKSISELETVRIADPFGLDLEDETAVEEKFNNLSKEIIKAKMVEDGLDQEKGQCAAR